MDNKHYTLKFVMPKQKILVKDGYLLNVSNDEFMIQKQVAQILIFIGFELKRLHTKETWNGNTFTIYTSW